MFVLSFVNFNPRVLSRMLRIRAQASHGNITVLSLLKISACERSLLYMQSASLKV